jgi:xylitol oxidase
MGKQIDRMEKGPLTNWAGNLIYSTRQLFQPSTIAELQSVIGQNKKLRVLGTKHSFNSIADSDFLLVSSAKLNRILSLDRINNTVTVEAGIKYGELCGYLQENGYALHNLASLPHISVAGACATATHGSGYFNGSLATGVTGTEFINGRGELVRLTKEKDGDLFCGAIVNLGALGMVTSIRLSLQPAFTMKQWIFREMPVAELENNFKAIMSAGYSVSLFTDWRNNTINQVWIKSKSGKNDSFPSGFYGAIAASGNLHPLEELSSENCTDQLGLEGPWHDRLPHFKMGFTPSSGTELQTEYFIPFEFAWEGFKAIEKLNARISPHLYVSEIRSIAADELWMSPFYKKTCVAFHFTWKQNWNEVQVLLPMIEEVLEPFKPLPHWGKLFSMQPQILQRRFEKLNDFKDLMAQQDPQGKFRNQFVDSIFN